MYEVKILQKDPTNVNMWKLKGNSEYVDVPPTQKSWPKHLCSTVQDAVKDFEDEGDTVWIVGNGEQYGYLNIQPPHPSYVDVRGKVVNGKDTDVYLCVLYAGEYFYAYYSLELCE